MAVDLKVLGFGSDALGSDSNVLYVMGLNGREEISKPYRFELDLISKENNIDFTAMLTEHAWIEIKQGVKLKGSNRRGFQTHKIHGVLAEFELLEERQDTYRYRAVLVPRLWRASLTFQSRIFMDKTIPEIVEEILTGSADGYQIDLDTSKITNASNPDHCPRREFVMQYEEDDLSFISRWLEHEGIFFYFEQTDSGEKMVLCDDKSAYVPMQGNSDIRYYPKAQTFGRVEARDSDDTEEDWFSEEVVSQISVIQRPVPKKVILKDYNYRNPSDPLKVEHDVSSNGFGLHYEYNNHYKTEGEGNFLAKTRAEEILCREKLLVGVSDCRSFRTGSTYKLKDHFGSINEKDYLLTEVVHVGEQDIDLDSDGVMGAKYHNEFVSIPADLPFRPRRDATWPSIGGFLNARVDGQGGSYANIDSDGRYKIKFPVDISDRSGGGASRYVRRAQPYAGGGMGQHFPLHDGTEVILAFADGDPDRPMIIGAVPNPETASPVVAGNNSQNVIQTVKCRIEMDDVGGSDRVLISSEKSGATLTLGAEGPGGQVGINMACDDNRHENIGIDSTSEVGSNRTENTGGNRTESTTGDRAETTDGARNQVTKKDWWTTTFGSFYDEVKGGKNVLIHGMDNKTVIMSSSEEIVGAKTSLILGFKTDTVIGLKTDIVKGGVVKCTPKHSWELSKDQKLKTVADKLLTESYQEKITTAEASITKLKEVIKTQQAKITTLEETIDTEKRKIKTLEETVDKFKGTFKDFQLKVDKLKIEHKKGMAMAMTNTLYLKNNGQKIDIQKSKIKVNGTALEVK